MTREIREVRREISGLQQRWLERPGDGIPAVFVHGIPASPELWRYVTPNVAAGRLLAWEMPGYGRSWDVPSALDISVGAQAGQLLGWLDALSIERAVLVGHDIGGGVVQIAATRAPERCAGLVLTNAISYDSWPIPEVKAMRAAGALLERLPRPLRRAQFSLVIKQGHDDRERARESDALHWRGYDHSRGGFSLIRQMRSLRTEDTQEVAAALSRLRVPAAVVWGAADRFQKLRYGRRLAADLDASIDEIDGGKHFVPEDHPARVATAVDSVWEQARSATG